MMKLIRNLICAGTLVLAVSAFGAKADNDANAKVRARKGSAQTTANANAGGAVHANRTAVRHNTNAQVNTNASLNRRHIRMNNEVREHNANTSARTRFNKTNTNVVNRKVVNRNVVNRNITRRNVRVVNSWRSSRFNSPQYVVFHNYVRQSHPSWWWRNHYSRVVFVNGGWYGWNNGWWYPCWGYSPGITFAFDGPIYGYNGWEPNRVTVAVQEQLQRDGYYTGPVDGQLGPETRQAIAAFQEDHGLVVTSAIDEPTLSTLGVA
jgi:hypothetical protein